MTTDTAPAAPEEKVSRRGQIGWALYQFASDPYFVMVNIFVFQPYFEGTIVGNYVHGQELWGYVQGAAGLLIALCSPVLGAIADAAGPRKPGLVLFSSLGLLAMSALWLAVPGKIELAAIIVIAAAVLMEFGVVYHNAMLTSVASPHRVGFLSGLAYSLGYVGGVVLFLIWLVLPALGLIDKADDGFAHERIVGPLCAIWLFVFTLPIILWTPDRARSGLSIFAAAGKGLRKLGRTLARVGHYRNIATYLVVRAIYTDGLSAVFAFLGGYAGGTFGWSIQKIGIYALTVLTVPAVTSAAGGWIDDMIGSKRTIQYGLFLFTLAVIGSISTTPSELFFVFPMTPALGAQQVPLIGPLLAMLGFTTFAEQVALSFAMLGAVFVGPILASSRTMVARLSPPEMISELYGLFTLTGKATAFVAPIFVGLVTGITQSQRAGFAVILIFLVAGIIGLRLVREERAVMAEQ
jgi:UMF1 family MFS transporter